MGESSATHVLSRCVSPEFGSLAKAIHSRTLKLGSLSSSLRLVTNLLAAYGRCAMADEACLVFDEMLKPTTHHGQDQLQPDLVSWNAVISACIFNHRDEPAFKYFRSMQASSLLPDSYTLSSILSSDHCSGQNMSSGEQIHCHIVKTGCILLNASVGNALITFYARWGRPAESVLVFESMPVKNVVTWTALISGHARRPGYEEESMRLFRFMMRENCEKQDTGPQSTQQTGSLGEGNLVFISRISGGCPADVGLFSNNDGRRRPNQFTFASILSACGSLASLEQGIQFISLAIKMGILEDIHVQNARVGFYSECGCLEDARSSFETIENPDTVSWNSLLKGYARAGRGREAIRDFEEMLTRGGKPDAITFLSVLSACSHSGMTAQGIQLFQKMEKDYMIEPQAEHIACVVNLLSRAGDFGKAKEFVEKKIECSKLRMHGDVPDASVWRTLLGACRIHGSSGGNGGEDLAEVAARRIVELEGSDSEGHVVLCNIYASRGRWDLVAEMRRVMRDKRVLKKAGYSWITIGGRVHCFSAADGGHPEIHGIETRLMELMNSIKIQEHE